MPPVTPSRTRCVGRGVGFIARSVAVDRRRRRRGVRRAHTRKFGATPVGAGSTALRHLRYRVATVNRPRATSSRRLHREVWSRCTQERRQAVADRRCPPVGAGSTALRCLRYRVATINRPPATSSRRLHREVWSRCAQERRQAVAYVRRPPVGAGLTALRRLRCRVAPINRPRATSSRRLHREAWSRCAQERRQAVAYRGHINFLLKGASTTGLARDFP